MGEALDGLTQRSARERSEDIPFEERMTTELIDRWGDGIPVFSEDDPSLPEWKATPTKRFDLSREGFGEVLIKDESVNPTGTMKDRPAWEHAALYRDFARLLYLKIRAGSLSKNDLADIKVPRLSLISEGNEAFALAQCFEKFGIPAVKVLLRHDIDPSIESELKRAHAEIYKTNLTLKALSKDDIRKLTSAADSPDITKLMPINESAVFYDWLVHEAFNERPQHIFVPYGSARLFENFIFHQGKAAREVSGRRDPRLHPDISITELSSMNIYGAEPFYPSVAKKLAAPFKPFIHFSNDDVQALKPQATGPQSGIYPIEDKRIVEAHEVMQRNGMNAEISAAAGLALYMERFEAAKVPKNERVLVVNTGKGLE